MVQVCLAPPGGQSVVSSGQNHRRTGPELWAGARSPGQAAAAGGGLDPEIVCGPDQHCRLGLPSRRLSSFSVSFHEQRLDNGKKFYLLDTNPHSISGSMGVNFEEKR